MIHKATIIIPLLTQMDEWLYQCVYSALSQTVSTEVLVVTSETTPKSNRDILNHLFKIRRDMRIVVQERPGFAAAVNTGIALASCERVGLLLSDDWLDAPAVEATIQNEADIVSTGMRFYSADGQNPLKLAPRWLDYQVFDRLPDLESKASYLTHFFMFRRSIIQRIGGLDESIGDTPGIDDYDLIWTLLERGATVALVNSPYYNYRDHDCLRLTLHPIAEMTDTMIKILTKHGVSLERQQQLLAQKARWFGRTLEDVVQDLIGDSSTRGDIDTLSPNKMQTVR